MIRLNSSRFKDVEISYDCEVDAGYIQLRKGEVHKTVCLSDDINVDLDKKGAVVGVEVLFISEVKPDRFHRKVSKFKEPALDTLNLKVISKLYQAA